MRSPYRTSVTPLVTTKIERYTLAIRDYYVALYSDTGLGEAEQVIHAQYIDGADVLNRSIISSMRTIFDREIIPYTPLENGLRETSFRLGTKRIFLIYAEDAATMTRYITDIEILRK